jgi:hypothetical protein
MASVGYRTADGNPPSIKMALSYMALDDVLAM